MFRTTTSGATLHPYCYGGSRGSRGCKQKAPQKEGGSLKLTAKKAPENRPELALKRK